MEKCRKHVFVVHSYSALTQLPGLGGGNNLHTGGSVSQKHMTQPSARSSTATTADGQLTDCMQRWWERKWRITPRLQAVKHRGQFIVPHTDDQRVSSVRNTLWGEDWSLYKCTVDTMIYRTSSLWPLHTTLQPTSSIQRPREWPLKGPVCKNSIIEIKVKIL